MTAASPVRHVCLTALVVLAVLAGLWFSLRQSEELTFARRNLPASCIQALADLAPDEARTRGVALRDCVRRHMKPDRKAHVVGPWSYGPADARVNGYIVWQRDTLPDSIVRDRLMHVSIIESHAVLNDFDVSGMSCAGGVKSVNLDQGNFGLVINLTPEALVRFATMPAVEKSYKQGDLLTDPRYCAAKLVLQDRRPVVIQLNAKPVTANDTPVPSEAVAFMTDRQQCLNTVIAKRVAKGETSLAFPHGYEMFVRDYVAACTAQH